jgi:tetratricopeptide (TPR) repeat protein
MRKNSPRPEDVTRHGIGLDPNSWSGHYYLGWALVGLNRLKEAEQSVREALRLNADSTEALHLLADIHSREKNYSALVDDLNEYLNVDPDSPAGARAKTVRDNAQRILDKGNRSDDLAQAGPSR